MKLMEEGKYEWGVAMHGQIMDALHVGPTTKDEAEKWLQDAIDDGIPEGLFYVVRREVGSWFEYHA